MKKIAIPRYAAKARSALLDPEGLHEGLQVTH